MKDIIISTIVSLMVAALTLFVTAGSVWFFDGWLFVFLVFSIGISYYCWLKKSQPDQLNNRLSSQDSNTNQRFLFISVAFVWLFVLIASGLSFRFGLSRLKSLRYLFAFFLLGVSCVILVMVFRINPNLSRAIEKQRNHKIVTSGI